MWMFSAEDIFTEIKDLQYILNSEDNVNKGN